MADRESAPPQARPSKRRLDEGGETAGPSQPKQSRDSEHADEEARPSTSQVSRSPAGSETDEQPQQNTMASSQSSRAGAHQQAGAAPEDIWIPFIEGLYPDLQSRTYCFPPLHFNRAPQVVDTLAGQTVSVRKNPTKRPGKKKPPPPPPAQVAGTVWVENPRYLPNVRIQDSDQQDDSAQQRCVQALSHIPNQAMMVISGLKFQNYLNNHPNPQYAAAIAQLPTIQHSSIPKNIADGECDIVVIHRQYGLMVGEIKSVGESSSFRSQTPGNQTQQIITKVEKALNQLNNQETALRHLVSDLPPVRITKTLLLPNISSGQLQSALSTSPPLLQELWRTLSLPTSLPADVSRAASHCMCQEDVGQPDTWWQTLHGSGQDLNMSDDVYRRLVARFCGPATTVDVPTAGFPRKVVRSMGEAVAETGLRFSSLTLTPRQVALLNTQPEPQCVYLLGPPGTGKTVVLLLKALEWVQRGHQVVVVSGDPDSRAVSLLLESQLRSMAGPAAANAIQRLCCDFMQDDQPAVIWGVARQDAQPAVTSLQQLIRPGPVLVICDEFVLQHGSGYIPWLTEVRHRLPAVTVWTAGIYRDDGPGTEPLPSWVQVETLQEALRCPPSVTAKLQQSAWIRVNAVLQYTAPQVAVATQGPQVQRLRHRGQPGHSGDHPWDCVTCAEWVADIIHQLRVGQPGQPLQYRDVWILYGPGDPPRAGDVLVRQLQQQHGLPVAVTSDPPSEDEAQELALAVSDQIRVAERSAVDGLERRVVVVLGSGVADDDLHACSRCSSSLYIIR